MDKWLLNALFVIAMALAGTWGVAIRQDVAEMKGSLQSIAAAVAATSAENALLRFRIERLERGPVP